MDNVKTDSKCKTETVILGLGSNLGNRFDNIIFAIQKLVKKSEITIIACSSVYESKAIGFKGEDFYNLTLAISCTLSPMALLNITQQIELDTGRQPNNKGIRSANYLSRKMDIDLLYFGNITLNNSRLIIPHPEINNRLFVIKPLLDMNYLLPLLCINNKETFDSMLDKHGVCELKLVSRRLKEKLKCIQLLK